jgi:hypothetical protein
MEAGDAAEWLLHAESDLNEVSGARRHSKPCAGLLKAARVKESEITGRQIQSLSYPLNPRQVLASQKIFSLFGIPQFLERVHQIESDKVDTLFNLLEVI